MGERPDIATVKEKFLFASYNRLALDAENHFFDENLKFTPLPTSTLELPNLTTSRAPAVSMRYTAAGGKKIIINFLQINMSKNSIF